MHPETELKDHPYIKEILRIEQTLEDRRAFHKAVAPWLLKMGADKDFLRLVIRRNLSDKGYLNQQWSMYNIPYFHVYETDDFILKIHLFPRSEQWIDGVAAHAIHHHNNYLLTTNAFFGSGYETFLFEKAVDLDTESRRAKLKVRKHFHQKDWNPSMVDSWEPHVVFVPETLSATMLMWSPDKKRSTDALRNVGLLKALKNPLRKIIQAFGMENRFGIAKAETFQFYPTMENDGFVAIPEEDYFAPSKAQVGPEINDYCMGMIFSFLQQADLIEKDYLQSLLGKDILPAYFIKWIQKVLQGETIPEVYHRKEIHIPQKNYRREDILMASGQSADQLEGA